MHTNGGKQVHKASQKEKINDPNKCSESMKQKEV